MYKKLLIGLVIALLCLSPIAAEKWNSFQGGVDHNAYREESSDFVTNLWTFNMESQFIHLLQYTRTMYMWFQAKVFLRP